MSNVPESRGRLLGRPSNNEADFNKFRKTITRLWSVENRTLKEVMEFMEIQHQFSATPKQYKTRFKEWKLRKNINTREMSQLARFKIENDVVGKRCTYLVRGEEVDPGKIDRFIRRNTDKLGEDGFKDFLIHQAKESYSVTPNTTCSMVNDDCTTSPSGGDEVYSSTSDVLNPQLSTLNSIKLQPSGCEALFLDDSTASTTSYFPRSAVLDQYSLLSTNFTSPETRSSTSSRENPISMENDEGSVVFQRRESYADIRLIPTHGIEAGPLDKHESIMGQIDMLDRAVVALDVLDEQHEMEKQFPELGEDEELVESPWDRGAHKNVSSDTHDENIAFDAPPDGYWSDKFDSEFETTPLNPYHSDWVPHLVHNAPQDIFYRAHDIENDLRNNSEDNFEENEPCNIQDTNIYSGATVQAPSDNAPDIVETFDSSLEQAKVFLRRFDDFKPTSPRTSPRRLPTLRSRFFKMRELVETSKQLERFRSRFIHHYEKMKWAGEVSPTDFQSISKLYKSHRQAWSIAILAMKKLCNLKRPKGLEEIMPFLCLARAVAEILDDDVYLKGFSSDLKLWKSLLKTPEDAIIFSRGVELMWDIVVDVSPSDFGTSCWYFGLDFETRHILFSLRENAADSLLKANSLFFPVSSPVSGGQPGGSRENSPGSHSQRSSTITDAAACPQSETTTDKEPPDREVSSNIDNFMQIATCCWMVDTLVVQLVTGVIFSVVLCFLQNWKLGTKEIDETGSLSAQKDTFTSFAASPISTLAYSDSGPCIDTSFMSPTLLSRPATPTIKPWYPTLVLNTE